MGIICGLVAGVLGGIFLSQNLASLFIGIPASIKHKAKTKLKYILNALLGVLVTGGVIALACTVLLDYVAWILAFYFGVGIIAFIFMARGFYHEALKDIASDKLVEMGVSREDVIKMRDDPDYALKVMAKDFYKAVLLHGSFAEVINISNRSRLKNGELFLVNYYKKELDLMGIENWRRESFFEKVWEVMDEMENSKKEVDEEFDID